ncbi:MAG: protein kinase [Planctomycetes bacterium]|nr:protein kinase [Planctomycetota bacterium]
MCKHCGRTFTLKALMSDTAYSLPQDTMGPESLVAQEGGIPKKLGRFKILSRLGSGAFGTVYWAHDPVLDREVALKVPRAAALEKPEARMRFLREPKAAAQLRHPHIVPVHDAGTDGEYYYIASAYIEGRTLEYVIAHQRPDFRRAAEITRDLAGALHYAHRMGVVHRDVKPANIMIDEQGQALLMDFGLARLESSEEKLTQDGSIMGTPAYMAPEQADPFSGEVGPASDQYSLGVVLYEALCGETPFSGPPNILIYNVVNQEPSSPRSRRREIPRDLETVCLKALGKRPADRYAHCGLMAEDLRRWLEGEPIHARRMGALERLGRWCRRNPAIATALATVVIVTLTALVAVTGAWGVAQANRELAETRLGELQDQQRETQLALDDANVHRALAEEKRVEAEEQRKLAGQALAEETAARTREKSQRERAEQALADFAKAQQETQSAETREALARQETLREQSRADANEYFNRIALAQKHWLAGQNTLAKEVLDSCPHELRQWEWRYLKRRVRGYFWRRPQSEGPCVFSPDGLRIACLSGETISVWDVPTARCLFTASSRQTRGGSYRPSNGQAITFSADGSRIAAVGAFELEGTDKAGINIRVLDGKTGESVQELEDASVSFVYGVSFSPDGERLACAAKIRQDTGLVVLKLWDANTGEPLDASPPVGNGKRVSRYDWIWDTGLNRVAVACGRFSKWGSDADSGQLVTREREDSPSLRGRRAPRLGRGNQQPADMPPLSPAIVSPDGRFHMRADALRSPPDRPSFAGNRRMVGIFDTRTNQSVTAIDRRLDSGSLSPDGQQVASADSQGLTVWDCALEQATFTVQEHPRGSCLAISPVGERFVSSGDETIKIWDTRTRGNLVTFEDCTTSVGK